VALFKKSNASNGSMKLNLVSCEVLYREICHLIARSPHQVDLRFLPKGLHDIGATGMVERLQAAVDAADMPGYDAILMGYALRNGMPIAHGRRPWHSAGTRS
jgi:hypothetical protein